MTLETHKKENETIFQGKFTLKEEGVTQGLEGNFVWDPASNQTTGNFQFPPLLEGKEKRLGPAGRYQMDLKAAPPSLAWSWGLTADNETLAYGPLRLKNLRGHIERQNKDTTANRIEDLSFNLPLEKSILHKGVMRLDFTNPLKPIAEIILFIYGGEIKTAPFPLTGFLPNRVALQISNIDLEHLFQDTGIRGFAMNGKLGGKLILTRKDNQLFIEAGQLQGEGRGGVKISENITNILFPGDDEKPVRLRHALDDYRYDTFEVLVKGPLSGPATLTIRANGNNPRMQNESSIPINLKIETPLGELLAKLLK